MLNSAEHEILKAHKYKNIKKFNLFQAQISLYIGCYFFLLINVKMPTIIFLLINCWHFNIYKQEKFHAQLSCA